MLGDDDVKSFDTNFDLVGAVRTDVSSGVDLVSFETDRSDVTSCADLISAELSQVRADRSDVTFCDGLASVEDHGADGISLSNLAFAKHNRTDVTYHSDFASSKAYHHKIKYPPAPAPPRLMYV